MTVLNAPATCRSPPACPARVRCCRRLIPTPARREDRTHAWGPVARPSPCREAGFCSRCVTGRAQTGRSRPGRAEREAGSSGLGEAAPPVCICGTRSRRFILRRALIVTVTKQKGKAVTLRLGLAGTPGRPASAQGPCAGPLPDSGGKKCDEAESAATSRAGHL